MLVSRASEPGNWKNIMHFSFHFDTLESRFLSFACPWWQRLLRARLCLLFSYTARVKVPWWEGEESCPRCDSVRGACSSSAKAGVCLCARLCLGHTFCKHSSCSQRDFKHQHVLRRRPWWPGLYFHKEGCCLHPCSSGQGGVTVKLGLQAELAGPGLSVQAERVASLL